MPVSTLPLPELYASVYGARFLFADLALVAPLDVRVQYAYTAGLPATTRLPAELADARIERISARRAAQFANDDGLLLTVPPGYDLAGLLSNAALARIEAELAAARSAG